MPPPPSASLTYGSTARTTAAAQRAAGTVRPPFLRQPEGPWRFLRRDCCLVCPAPPCLAQDRLAASVLPPGSPLLAPCPRPSPPPPPRVPAARRPPTFSWALLNFFCTCLAKRPAAPPALPSAILPAPQGRLPGLWFSEAPEEEVRLPPSMPRFRRAGRSGRSAARAGSALGPRPGTPGLPSGGAHSHHAEAAGLVERVC